MPDSLSMLFTWRHILFHGLSEGKTQHVMKFSTIYNVWWKTFAQYDKYTDFLWKSRLLFHRPRYCYRVYSDSMCSSGVSLHWNSTECDNCLKFLVTPLNDKISSNWKNCINLHYVIMASLINVFNQLLWFQSQATFCHIQLTLSAKSIWFTLVTMWVPLRWSVLCHYATIMSLIYSLATNILITLKSHCQQSSPEHF